MMNSKNRDLESITSLHSSLLPSSFFYPIYTNPSLPFPAKKHDPISAGRKLGTMALFSAAIGPAPASYWHFLPSSMSVALGKGKAIHTLTAYLLKGTLCGGFNLRVPALESLPLSSSSIITYSRMNRQKSIYYLWGGIERTDGMIPTYPTVWKIQFGLYLLYIFFYTFSLSSFSDICFGQHLPASIYWDAFKFSLMK